MTTVTFAILLAIATLLQLSAPVPCEAAEAADDKRTQSPPTYLPPLRGAPSTRVGGGTRGDEGLALSVLAPVHTGWTSKEQPTLYWHAGAQVSAPVEITVMNDETLEKLVERTLSPPVAAGTHGISLRDLNVRLETNVEYRWFVAVVLDADDRSRDLVAGATIRRVAAPASLIDGLSGTDDLNRARLYASKGYWYDSIEVLSSAVAAQPRNQLLREARIALLEQVALKDAAVHDRSALNL